MRTTHIRRTAIVTAVALATLLAASCSGTGSGDGADQGRGAPGSDPTADLDVSGSTGAPAVRLTRSNGCDTGATPTTGTDEEITIPSGTATRTYLQHVPAIHDGATALPVIVDLHGYTEGARIHTAMSNLGPDGDTLGYITITPQGEGPVPHWVAEVGSDDVAFIGNVLDDVESNLCVDLDRVYVTGFSNGAFLTSALVCSMADRFAAAAPVAGIQDPDGCTPSRPVPVIAFHGTADTFVSYDGSLGSSVADLPSPDGSGATIGDLGEGDPSLTGPSVPDITAAWAARNGCDAVPTETPVTDDVTQISFGCPAGAEVSLYRVDGGGHAWPGSEFSASIGSVTGATTMSIDANELMWAFFEAHPMPS